MSAWILIIVLWGDSITTQEFGNEAACVRAGEAISKAKGGTPAIRFVCTPQD